MSQCTCNILLVIQHGGDTCPPDVGTRGSTPEGDNDEGTFCTMSLKESIVPRNEVCIIYM